MSRFRLSGVFWFVLVIASGATNFLVKQNVQNLDSQLAHVRHQAADEQKKIHDLTREWTTLNQPELLANLNNSYVHLVPVSPKQVETGVDAIPLRPAPPAPPQDVAPQITPAQAAPPATVAAPVTPTPIVPVSAIVPARVQVAPAPATAPVQPASLDALFAQVTGGR